MASKLNRLPENDLRRLLADQRTGTPLQDLAQKWGMTITNTRLQLEHARGMIPAEFTGHDLGTPLHLSGDFIVAGDWHIPLTDWGFAQNVTRLADKTGIRRLIINGDFFNMDSFSRYESILPPVTWAQERDAARVMLLDLLETFTEIYTLAGNHERRLTKWAAGNLEEADIYGMVAQNPKIINSPFGYCTVDCHGVPWRITHPTNYGKNQLTVLSDIANKFQTNVIGGHQHHNAIGWDVYKRFVCVDMGMLADEKKFAYVQMDDNRMANMVKGFVILRLGVATPLSVYPFTDWSMWLG